MNKQNDYGINVLSAFDGMSCGQLALERAGIKVNNYYASQVDKFAMAVTQYHYPNTVQLGDINNFEEWDLPQIDLLMGGSPCFIAGTKVICKNEIKPIEEVLVGDEVLTHTGDYKKVLKTGGDVKNIYKIKAQGHTSTLTTSNHPYYIRKRNKVWDNNKRTYEWVFSKPEWVEVGDLIKGDYVGTPILNSNKNPYNLTADECYLLGIYIGDGHTRKDFRTSEGRLNDRYWQLIISVGSHEKEIFNETVNLKHSFYKHTKSVYRAVFSNKRLVQIAEEHCGIGAENKKFSKMILDLPVNLLQKVIDGYEFADGSNRNKVFRATTISKNLVETLSLAIAKVYKTTCSIEYTIRPKTTIIEGRTVNQNNTWTISYRKKHKKQSRAWVIDNIIWNPIKSIEQTQNNESVYNIEVETDNSYIANNHIVHNCQGFSFAGKQLNFEDPRSKLFFKFVDALKKFKPKYFLLENVRMKKEYQDVISNLLGVEPIVINSSLLSAQNRVRLYWTNIPNITQPEDKGLVLKDIIEYGEVGVEKSQTIKSQYARNSKANFEHKSGSFHATGVRCIQVGEADLKGRRSIKAVYSPEGKCPTLVTPGGGHHEPKIVLENSKCIQVGKADLNGHDYIKRVYSPEGKCPTLNANGGGNLEPKIVCGASRGRYVDKDKTSTSQMIELRKDEKTNTITSVQKDNLVVYLDEHKSKNGLICLAGINKHKRWLNNGKTLQRNFSQGERIYSSQGKCPCLSANSGGTAGPGSALITANTPKIVCRATVQKNSEHNTTGKSTTLTSAMGMGGGNTPMLMNDNDYKKYKGTYLDGETRMQWRKLTPLECERLQTVPDNHTLVPYGKRMMSNSQRYKMLGNGWTVDVIAHIFLNMK